MNKIHLISGPRNLSTALMYSFGNRADTAIVDEPFYGYYLDSYPHIDHPGREEVIAEMETDPQVIIKSLKSDNYKQEHLFIKNMAHHMRGLDLSLFGGMKQLFLIRDPAQLIASFAQVIPEPTMEDLGLETEADILDELQRHNQPFCVLNSGELLKDPTGVLNKLCAILDMPFSEEMLQWPAGPRKEDGVWAKYWYASVHQSTGFAKQPSSSRPFPERLRPLLRKAMIPYERLNYYSIKA